MYCASSIAVRLALKQVEDSLYLEAEPFEVTVKLITKVAVDEGKTSLLFL